MNRVATQRPDNILSDNQSILESERAFRIKEQDCKTERSAMTEQLANSEAGTVVGYRAPELDIEQRQDGVLILRHPEPAKLMGLLVTEVLQNQAAAHPDRVFLKQRSKDGWASISYRDFLDKVNVLGEGLIARGLLLGVVVIVATENSIETALLSMAVMTAGGVVAPIAPQMLAGNALDVRKACATLDAFAIVCDKPIATLEAPVSVSISINEKADGWIDLTDLENFGKGRSELHHRSASLTADSPAKILFTSGSTGYPKPVINTHGMLSAAQDISRQLFTQLKAEGDEVYRLTDWLPWHHTYGGNSNFNGVLWQAGMLVIDPGKPAPGLFAQTVLSLKAEPPSVYIGVPASFAMLAAELEADDEFATDFFGKVRALVSGGAALAPSLKERLQALSYRATGRPVLIGGGYGMTETCAMITQIYWQGAAPDTLGLPPPGIELKLVPYDETRFECRVRGPNVTPGYFSLQGPDAADMFDDEHFFITGDTLSFVDPEKPEEGLVFAGRVKEEFKLATGTWVRVGQMRVELLDALTPLVKDAVIVGENRDDVRALLWLEDEVAIDDVHERIAWLGKKARGQSKRLAAAAALQTPPDPARGELTAKGTLNQIRLRQNRIHEISALYAIPVSDTVNK